MDYTGANSKKSKEDQADVPVKLVDKIVVGEVIVQKKSLGRKIRDMLTEADFRSVASYVLMDVIIPSAKNLFVDAVENGARRMVYRGSSQHYRGYNSQGSRITYNNPINRGGYGPQPPLRRAPTPEIGPRRSSSNQLRNDFLLTSREEADLVLENMANIIDTYDAVSLSDLNQMLGLPAAHTDLKWGWTDMAGANVRQVREGYLIELPAAEPL